MRQILQNESKEDYGFAVFVKDEAQRISEYSDEKASAVFARFAKNHTWQCPTLTVLRSEAFLNDPNFLKDPRLKYMPKAIRKDWDPKNDPDLSKFRQQDFANTRLIFEKSMEVTGQMNRAGVGILAGTDTLNPYCFPGFSLHDELELLVQAGLTPLEALRAATINPAKYMNRSALLGSIEKGKVADLLMLEADPLKNIRNTRNIAAVVVAGKLYPKAGLQKMLNEAEKLASKESIGEFMETMIAQKGVAKAIAEYIRLKATAAETYNFSEGELNRLGYRLLQSKQVAEAIAIFKLNVEAFPLSGNTYDSLAEAYLSNGEKDLAIQSYRRSLELNPANSNAAQKLKELQQ